MKLPPGDLNTDPYLPHPTSKHLYLWFELSYSNLLCGN